ncbi:MAG: LON peptidase substrate-binding domain-containing protein [Verrucomicrobiae bacterium]|nr:LON peptidase substrate-binding domain-containing protein [Verrucomicrobiae bacterium]
MSENDSIEMPDSLPVMVLPCTLFPHCLMPLFIFEPRYRAMLAQALESERFFCIGTSDPDADPDNDERTVAPISTAGIVRACVTHDDGTSHLLLLGTRRIRFVDWIQTEPFRIATIETVECEIETPDLADQLAREAIELTADFIGEGRPMSPQVHDHLRSLDDPSAVADVIAHSFITDPRQRQQLLETLEVGERLHRLSQYLHARIADQS